MNVDAILTSLNAEGVEFILIGGMNFLLRHVPELTFDVDIWIKDNEQNLQHLNKSLQQLGAEWGRTEKEWRPVSEDWHWLQAQPVFCLTTRHGALDVFRSVLGLENQYDQCRRRAFDARTASGVSFASLSDEDMLVCRESLPFERQKLRRDSQCKKGEMKTVNEIKAEEERKRELAYDPVARWLHIQQTITWAEANLPPEKRRNRPRQPFTCQPLA